ncbi:YraN family protein [Tindallia californiensis]|uniref:UPF0102 protein SAMN05192546_105271 n=1 Tax=Tindallia californiensis TaxID=159292 RepID=A0A1H3NT93_9FIRM|nr:YraN family protein [Tindallia californiensis]SDY91920.1 putative endonuclease [Tindallia californiensis]
MTRQSIGKQGEAKAKSYLLEKGYSILNENFRTKLGEIDIVIADKDSIVFVEVKSRRTGKYGLPREAITSYKQSKIRKVALLYIKKYKLEKRKVRFDVVEIFLDETLGDEFWKVNHIINAF